MISLAAAALDHVDRAILKLVQRDNQLSHGTIGERVGLSASSVRRRLTSLRAAGVICADVSIVRPDVVGITLIVSVSFERESVEAYDAFEEQMRRLPEVRQCYSVAGDTDYMLVVSSPSLADYEAWAKREFMSNPALRRYDSTVVWSCAKYDTALPLDECAR